jgi:hypothetical protein
MVGSGRKQPWPISQQYLATEQERALVGVLLLQKTSSRDIAACASGRPMLKLQAPAVSRRKQQVGGASDSGPKALEKRLLFRVVLVFLRLLANLSFSYTFIYLLSSSFPVSS